LESVLIEHPAVVPAPDPVRLAVPKAYIALAAGHEPTRETALDILRYARRHLPSHQRVHRLEFFDLPKTISGKIRRVELRAREQGARPRRTNFVTTTLEETREGERRPPVARLGSSVSFPSAVAEAGIASWRLSRAESCSWPRFVRTSDAGVTIRRHADDRH
jgi:hypothetical protein